MTTTSESLRQAVDPHRNGQFDVAEQLYRQVLSSEPHHPEALHLMGLVAQQRGEYATAVDWIGRAIAANGLDPAYHANLASCYFALGQTDNTIACLRAVLRLRPDHAKTHNDLGMLLANLGRFDEAAECFRQVL